MIESGFRIGGNGHISTLARTGALRR